MGKYESLLTRVDLYPHLPSADKAKIEQALERAGFDSSLIGAPPTLDTGFRCPVIDETISTCCGIENCRYHVDYEWSANCLLAYLHQQESDRLSTEEVAFLYHRPHDQIKTLQREALNQLRSTALDIDRNDDDRLKPRFEFLSTTKVCCVCESSIDTVDLNRHLEIPSVGAVYCSKDCREEKPPQVVELEIKKGLPIKDILEWTFSHYRSPSLAEQALGIPRWLALDLCKRYLGHPLEHYFPQLLQSTSRPFSRRTWHTPRWVTKMMESIKPVTRKIYSTCGPSMMSFQQVDAQLSAVLEA